MVTIAPHRVHLANGDTLARCGRSLSKVFWTEKKDEATCNSCRVNAGLAKAPRVTRSLNPRPSKEPPPAVGQIWEDVQARSEGRKRRLTIVRVEDEYVYFFAITDITKKGPRKALRERFIGNMRGYRYVGENEE